MRFASMGEPIVQSGLGGALMMGAPGAAPGANPALQMNPFRTPTIIREQATRTLHERTGGDMIRVRV